MSVRLCRSTRRLSGRHPAPLLLRTSVHVRTRMSKRGNALLRAALYFPAMVALRHNPIIRAFGERLKASGHAPKSIIGAAMRKLLHLVFGVLQSGHPFDPAYASQALA